MMDFLRYPAYLYYVPQAYWTALGGQTSANENSATADAQPSRHRNHNLPFVFYPATLYPPGMMSQSRTETVEAHQKQVQENIVVC
jgi:hypothetical protein